MGELIRRRGMIKKEDASYVAYEAYNLSFDSSLSTYIDTGIYLFSPENIGRDFEFLAEDILGVAGATEQTIICSKQDSTSYGFLVRTTTRTDTAWNGTIHVMYGVDATVCVRRINGVITLSGEHINNPSVRIVNSAFNLPLVLGCALQDNGTPYRYASGTIGHVKVTWL